jgi:oxygen-independent coproporphyrinogen-3 oxidase
LKGFEKFLISEIHLQQEYLRNQQIKSVYFGGGTPSLLSPDSIKNIIEEIRKNYLLDSEAEITLEANPDDLTINYLKELITTGVNRISIGVQSFHEEDLVYLNRVHHATQAESCIRMAIEAGFTNLSIDLIYGIPGLSPEKWQANLDYLSKYGIKHFSAYWLTVEPKTNLELLIRKNKTEAPDEGSGITHFSILQKWAAANNYNHYEISNFCKEGFEARHNTAYWSGESYLGIGPSAHSFNGDSRQWNIANLDQYCKAIQQGIVPFEKEELTVVQKYNEYVMTSLRTLKGCDSSIIYDRFGEKFANDFKDIGNFYLSEGLLKLNNGVYTLTDQGMLLADSITADLFQAGDNID